MSSILFMKKVSLAGGNITHVDVLMSEPLKRMLMHQCKNWMCLCVGFAAQDDGELYN